METFIVDNIVFYDRNLAMQAEKEWKKVKLLQEKLDEKNMANVAVMYQKAVEGNFFQTPVGMAYLLKLRQLLRENGYEDLTAEKQINCLLQSIQEKQAGHAAGKRSRAAAALQEAEMYCRYARGSGDRTFCDQPDREKSNDHQLQIEDCKPVCIMGAGTERKRSGGQRKGSAAWYHGINQERFTFLS